MRKEIYIYIFFSFSLLLTQNRKCKQKIFFLLLIQYGLKVKFIQSNHIIEYNGKNLLTRRSSFWLGSVVLIILIENDPDHHLKDF